jgi:hypothetical protein
MTSSYTDIPSGFKRRFSSSFSSDNNPNNPGAESPCAKRARRNDSTFRQGAEVQEHRSISPDHDDPSQATTTRRDFLSVDVQMQDLDEPDEQQSPGTNNSLDELFDTRDTQLEELWTRLQAAEHQVAEVKAEVEALSKKWRRLRNKVLRKQMGVDRAYI